MTSTTTDDFDDVDDDDDDGRRRRDEGVGEGNERGRSTGARRWRS